MNRLTPCLLVLVLLSSVAGADDGGYVTIDQDYSRPVQPYGQQQEQQRQRQQQGTPVYPAADCIGAVVNGVCHGSVIPDRAVPVRCYGQMLNGVCTGPQF